MIHPQVLLLASACLVLFSLGCAHTLTFAEAVALQRGSGRVAPDDLKANLPDPNNKQTRGELKCSACLATAKRVFTEARTMDEKRRKALPNPSDSKKGAILSDVDWVEVLDDICPRVVKNNGLLMMDNKATTTYADINAVSMVNGQWVNSFLEDTCVTIVEENEAQIKEHYLSFGSAVEMQSQLCQHGRPSATNQKKNKKKKAAYCTAEDFSKHQQLINGVLEQLETNNGAEAFYNREKKKARAQAAKEAKEKAAAEEANKKLPENTAPRNSEL